MKKEIADLWITDLRTNPPQCKDYLYDGEGYCCLGRLCLIIGKKFIKNTDLHYQGVEDTVNKCIEYAVLPADVQKLVGMKSACGNYNMNTDLTQLNDEGKTFAEIADIIEQHWEEL